jgi:hypothetical protein
VVLTKFAKKINFMNALIALVILIVIGDQMDTISAIKTQKNAPINVVRIYNTIAMRVQPF